MAKKRSVGPRTADGLKAETYEISPDLNDVRTPPNFRGMVDECTSGVVRGWCLSTIDPLEPIIIDIVADGQNVGTFETGAERGDVQALVSLPVRPGFNFTIGDRQIASLRGRQSWIGRPMPIPDIMFRIRGENLRLPVSARFTWSEALRELPLPFERSTEVVVTQTAAANISNLGLPPPYRGNIDSLNGLAFAGWCLSAENVQTMLKLDFYFSDIMIGSALSGLPRPDISTLLNSPATPGFRFNIVDLASSSVDGLQDQLKRVGPRSKVKELVRVRVSGTGFDLPFEPEIGEAELPLEAFRKAVSLKQKELSANSRNSLRAELLDQYSTRCPPPDTGVKIVAFYLPQFHSIPENDEWWGKGFSEWTNVVRAKPLFEGHSQPKIPADLGFYDLRVAEAHRQQIDLAKQYGISAFCYHHYWFSGTKLLSMSVDRHCSDNLDLDFCLCWANENWSRRWDGSENEVLMMQEHTQSDDLEFIYSVMSYFGHERYLKLAGAPLLLIYRISLIPNPKATIEAWRAVARDAGYPDLHVCMAETFGLQDPREFGADSSCQFPPHGIVVDRPMNDRVKDLAPEFTGVIYDYLEVAANEVKRPDPGFLRFRCAVPSWDNTSRRGKAGNVLQGATPDIFQAWLSVLCAKARRDHDEGSQLVFINAWNEWSEGAYLEPDTLNGHKNLKAVRSALTAQNMMLGSALIAGPGGAEPKALPELLETISALSSANRLLLKFIEDHNSWKDEGPTPLIQFSEGALGTVLTSKSGKSWVDDVNGRRVQSTTVTVSKRRLLGLRGWLQIPDVDLSEDLPLFINLYGQSTSDQSKSYIAGIYQKEKRPDVISHFREAEGQWNGFYCLLAFEDVEPGIYFSRFLVTVPNQLRASYAVASDIILHVG